MSVLAEIDVPASEFVLADTLTEVPEMRIEIKRVVAGTDEVTPYFWASGDDFVVFEQALRDDTTVQDVLTLEDHADDERFYRVTWQSSEPNLMSAIEEAKATILEAASDGSEWEMKTLFPDRADLSEFFDYCQKHGFSVQLSRVYEPENPEEEAEYGVTDDQQEALVEAFHAGYFAVPRDRTLTELATQMDLSRNALSARLRRGQYNLLANTLIHDE